MKSWKMIYWLVLGMTMSGCEFEAPLTQENSLPVDNALLGLWEPAPDDEEPPPEEEMMILKFSATEYLIHYPTCKDGIYYRGYPIKIGDVACIQLQVLGNSRGPVAANFKELYHVATYRLLDDGRLEIKTLNLNLIPSDLKTSEALCQAFLKNKDKKNLFTHPGLFKKVGQPEPDHSK